jgi:hypothetical protein
MIIINFFIQTSLVTDLLYGAESCQNSERHAVSQIPFRGTKCELDHNSLLLAGAIIGRDLSMSGLIQG